MTVKPVTVIMSAGPQDKPEARRPLGEMAAYAEADNVNSVITIDSEMDRMHAEVCPGEVLFLGRVVG